MTPAGWFFKESITLLSPDGQANVIFSSEPLDESTDLVQYESAQLDLLAKEFPGFKLISDDEPVVLSGIGSAIRRTFTWTPPDGSPVIQMQLYAVRPGRGFTATATTVSDNFDDIRHLLSETLASLAVGGSPTT